MVATLEDRYCRPQPVYSYAGKGVVAALRSAERCAADCRLSRLRKNHTMLCSAVPSRPGGVEPSDLTATAKYGIHHDEQRYQSFGG
jgi:hypothetical protein